MSKSAQAALSSIVDGGARITYTDNMLLQKEFIENPITRKRRKNNGQLPQYFVENTHEAIIDPETFEMIKRELSRRTNGKNRHSGVHLLSGRIKCGD